MGLQAHLKHTECTFMGVCVNSKRGTPPALRSSAIFSIPPLDRSQQGPNAPLSSSAK